MVKFLDKMVEWLHTKKQAERVSAVHAVEVSRKAAKLELEKAIEDLSRSRRNRKERSHGAN